MNGEQPFRRRSVLKAIAAAGAIGTMGGVVSAESDDVDREQLKELRKATSKYHNLEKAEADGYVLDESHCVPNMGFHAANGALIDRNLSPSDPEILVYEKTDDGYNLVAVEFVSMHPTDEPAPKIIGHEMHLAPHLPFNWALHVWAWKNNPNGLFADFNPRIGCPK